MNLAPREPNVLHLWPDYVPGHMGDPHRLLRERTSWSSRVLTLRLMDAVGGASIEGVEWLARVRPGAGSSLIGRVVRRLTGPINWGRLRRRYRRAVVSSDLVHLHFGTTAARVDDITFTAGLPAVVTFYGVDGSAAVRDPAWSERYRSMLGHATRVVVLCDAVRDRLVAAGAERDRIRVWRIPCGVERYRYREPERDVGVRFITAARFVEKKGYDYLLPAFAKLREEGLQASLTIIGFGPLRAHIEQRVAELELTAHVRIIDTSTRGDFHELYDAELSQHDIFVLPSVSASDGDDEGGPALTLVLAQAAGLPVICTHFPGSELSVIDGVTGKYCPEADSHGLADVMRQVANDPTSWSRMGRAASELAKRDFSVDGQFEALLAVYREALDDGHLR